ncbi:Clustered mitochondria protein-like protein [Larimichthys crocea]|uniref:Uncharacterized protein n=1 Tax=Larimichthys crocea TaxID=215358 RepID=A0ACD3Q955_LARCR|nr:Clustered mitochondria protein-like protein [Larimichthys crocea]
MKDKVRRGGGRNQAKTDVIGLTGRKDAAGMKQDEDTSFPVKIQGAGVEPFELQVHGFWLVQDAVMTLLSRDEVCPRSNLSLALAGTNLDPLAELQSLKGLKPGAVLRLVEEPYSARSVQLHLARVLELLRVSGPQDALREGRSPSILETLTHTQTPDSGITNGKSLKRSLSNTKTETTNQDGAPPEYLLPGSSDRPLMALLPQSSQPEAPDWNEELQTARDLPHGNLEERLQRDRAVLQINSAFVRAVMQGAETVIDGFVEPVNGNPVDPAFLWGGLFMSQGAASAMFGGERGRRAAQRLELKGVQAYSNIEGVEGLHTLPTAIVDYRGVRLSAQGLAPGLEGSEQDQATAPASRVWTRPVSLQLSVTSSAASSSPTSCPLLLERRLKRSRGGVAEAAGASESTPWSTLTGAELWNLVCQDAVETYNISDCLGSGPNHLVEHYGLQKLSLLREFCLKTGVQLRLKDYCLDNQNKAPIGPDDILNIFPVVKHINTPTVDASKAHRAAQTFLQKGLLDQAHEHLKEAAYLYGRVCDDLNPEACYCHSMLAKVAFLQGKAAEARSVQLKAVVISERVLGFDHPNTIQQYALLGVYAFAGGETALAQKCVLRARLLTLTVHGEDHPYIATLDSCLGLMLTGDQTGQYLKNALRLNTSFFGAINLHTALNQHMLAQWMCSKGDYRSAMTHEKEALTAFTTLFGEDHAQTRCSKEFLCTITKQAVKVERSLRQAGADCTEQTVECLSPTNDTVLEQMVLVTGIRRLTQSDRFQEYRQKHKELKAAVAKELGFKVTTELVASEAADGGEKNSDGETGYGKEAEDGGSSTVQKASESQQEQPVEETIVESTANGHVVEPAEQNHLEDSDRAGSGAEVSIVNGESEVRATGEETKSSTANGEVKSDAAANEMKSDEVNGDINGTPTSPSVLKSKGTWADIVSKAPVANGTAVNGVADKVTANGVAEG